MGGRKAWYDRGKGKNRGTYHVRFPELLSADMTELPSLPAYASADLASQLELSSLQADGTFALLYS